MDKGLKMILGVAAIGGLAYFLFTKQANALFGSSDGSFTSNGSFASTISQDETPRSEETQRERTEALSRGLSSNTLQRTQLPLAKSVQATGNAGSGFQGKTLTGQIGILADGSTKFIATQQPAKDSQGRTYFDKPIKVINGKRTRDY